jgi:hypothetical protein
LLLKVENIELLVVACDRSRLINEFIELLLNVAKFELFVKVREFKFKRLLFEKLDIELSLKSRFCNNKKVLPLKSVNKFEANYSAERLLSVLLLMLDNLLLERSITRRFGRLLPEKDVKLSPCNVKTYKLLRST